MAASDVYYEIAAPITDRSSLGSGEALRQVCIKLKHKLYQASTNLKSAKDIIGIWTAVTQWLTCCATYRKVVGSIPDGVTGIFH
jgi:hypothetical protein